MPVISIPEMFLDRTVTTPTWRKVRVEGRTVRAVVAELFDRFPILRLKYPETARPEDIRWFGLWRDDGEEDLRHQPDTFLGADEALQFVSMLGC